MFQTRKEDMAVERKPTAFGDLRGWIEALAAHGELQEIDAEVDWNIELGTIMRLAQGPGTGKALLFNNIKDYNKPDDAAAAASSAPRSTSYRRIAMMLGLPPDTHPRELVKIGRTILTGSIPPKIVATGPVKENILTGDDIDLYDFPSPHWNRLDGGRYLLTYGGCVTKDPETGIMNVGIYRGMVAGHDRIPILMWRAQHIGHHFTAWQNGGEAEMPIAVAIGWEPSLGFTGGSPVPKGDVRIRRDGRDPRRAGRAGQMRDRRPLRAGLGRDRDRRLSRARPQDLHDGRARIAEFTGYLAGDRAPKPDHPRHRHHPPQRSDPARHHRGLDARQLFGERRVLVDHARRHRLERARPRRRARHHRRVVPAGADRHQRADPA